MLKRFAHLVTTGELSLGQHTFVCFQAHVMGEPSSTRIKSFSFCFFVVVFFNPLYPDCRNHTESSFVDCKTCARRRRGGVDRRPAGTARTHLNLCTQQSTRLNNMQDRNGRTKESQPCDHMVLLPFFKRKVWGGFLSRVFFVYFFLKKNFPPDPRRCLLVVSRRSLGSSI